MEYNKPIEKGFAYRVVQQGENQLEVMSVYHEDYKPVRLSKGQLFLVGYDLDGIRRQLKALNDATMLPIVNIEDLEK